MNELGNSIKPRMWLMASLLAALVAGCGGGGGSETAAGTPVPPVAGAPTVPGVGPGAGPGGQGPAPVNLGVFLGSFAILAESTITNVPPSVVTGHVGLSPADGAALLLTCAEVTGNVYTVNAAGPTLPCQEVNPSHLNALIADKGIAYTDAQGRAPDYTEVGAGNIGGMTLPPAVYKWGTGVLIPTNTNVTLSGGPNDVWIFQIAEGLTVSSGVQIILAGGAQAQNVYWATFGVADLGTTSQFKGVILSQTSITMKTGASINGRLFAGTAVTLEQNTVTAP